jgi:hypothetical protein
VKSFFFKTMELLETEKEGACGRHLGGLLASSSFHADAVVKKADSLEPLDDAITESFDENATK